MAASPVLTSLKLLVGTVMGSLVVMGAALWLVLGAGAPPLWVVVLLLVLGVVVQVVIQAVGYRVQPIPAHTDAAEVSRLAATAFRTSLMVRLALAESVALIGLVLAFAAGHTVLGYAVGAAVSLLLLALHAWPSLRSIDRVVAALEADGARTGLRSLLGVGGPQDGTLGPIS